MIDKPDTQAEQSPSPPIPPWGRNFALAVAAVFLISLVFPIGAGLSKDTSAFPKWWGLMDVTLAFMLGCLTVVIFVLAHGKVTSRAEAASYRVYRQLIHIIFVLLLVFLVFGDQITWINGLPGLAWRAWLLLYSLPTWFVVFDNSPKSAQRTTK